MIFLVTVKENEEPYLEVKLNVLECAILSVTPYAENLLLYKVSGGENSKQKLIKSGYLVDEEMFGTIGE